jgi:hypothetical protein
MASDEGITRTFPSAAQPAQRVGDAWVVY